MLFLYSFQTKGTYVCVCRLLTKQVIYLIYYSYGKMYNLKNHIAFSDLSSIFNLFKWRQITFYHLVHKDATLTVVSHRAISIFIIRQWGQPGTDRDLDHSHQDTSSQNSDKHSKITKDNCALNSFLDLQNCTFWTFELSKYVYAFEFLLNYGQCALKVEIIGNMVSTQYDYVKLNLAMLSKN